MLWLALSVLAACAAALVTLPFLRTRAPAPASLEPADIYKEQLQAITTDVASGDLDQAAGEEMRAEVARRILAAPQPPRVQAASAKLDRVTAGIVAAIVVFGAIALYGATGAPNVQSAQNTQIVAGAPPSMLTASAAGLADVDTMIEALRQRLEAEPDDAEGWRMLGWSYFETNRFGDAVEAYRRAVAIAPQNASFQSALAEALTQASAGRVTDEARRLFQAAYRRDRSDERARFYLALAKSQGADKRGAIDDWIAGVRDAAADSQWSPRMRTEAENLARQIGMDISGRLPAAPMSATSAFPTSAAAEIQRASPEDQAQMIAGMVGGLEQRLAQNPRDAEGWVMLMRSRMVLNEPQRARQALRNGLDAFAGDVHAQARLRAAGAELGVPDA